VWGRLAGIVATVLSVACADRPLELPEEPRGIGGDLAGLNDLAPPDLASPPRGCVTQVSAGLNQTCAVERDGSVWCWGLGAAGCNQLQLTPVRVQAWLPATQVAVGAGNGCVLLIDGLLVCWGCSDGWLIMSGDDVSGQLMPAYSLGYDVAMVSLDGTGACAVKEDGTLWRWGGIDVGSLGDPTATPVPEQVPEVGNDVVAASCGGEERCAVEADGTLWCWGMIDALGASVVTPAVVGNFGGTVVATSGTKYMVCALTAEHAVWCAGQAGQTNFHSPSEMKSLHGHALEVSVGDQLACARLDDGTVECWGQSWDGSGATLSQPTPVAGVSGATQISVGAGHACAVVADGNVRCWGANTSGQLGAPVSDFEAAAVRAALGCPND
jgi:alpha-tubulin suppressor-like RCC1 family protein